MTYSFNASSLVAGTNNIKVLINDVEVVGQDLDHKIDVAIKSAIIHAHVHGDYDLINRLVNAMPKGSRVAAVKKYALLFAPVKVNEDKETNKTSYFVYDRDRLNKEFVDSEDYIKMLGTHWTASKAPKVEKTSDEVKAAAIKQAETLKKKFANNPAAFSALNAFIAAL